MGSVSALGVDLDGFWKSLSAGVCGLRNAQVGSGANRCDCIVGAADSFDPTRYFDAAQLAELDRFTQLALVASREAIRDSGLDLTKEPDEVAVVIGTGGGGENTRELVTTRLHSGLRSVHPLSIPAAMPSAPCSHIAMENGITGPVFSTSSACASSTHAVGIAVSLIRQGAARIAVAGGSDASLTYPVVRAWQRLRVLSTDTCRPFSRGRKGLVLAEGAGVVVLEKLRDAERRGAPIYAEVAGFGMCCDAFDLLKPSKAGMLRCMKKALDDAEVDPGDVGYINAHGTGTVLNDVLETRAIRDAFHAQAERISISSTKSMHGHALGASGALELVATAMSVREGIVPPTANYAEPDPECDLDYVPNQARELSVKAAMTNSFAFGGLNAVLVLKRL